MKLEINGQTYEFSSEADASTAKSLAAAEHVRTCNAMSGAAARAMGAQIDDAGKGHRTKDGGYKDMDGEWHTQQEDLQKAGFDKDAIKAVDTVKTQQEAAATTEATQAAELASVKKQLADALEVIAKLQSEEGQEAVAKESEEYKADETAVANALPEAEKKPAEDEVKNCKTRNEKRKALTVRVLNSQGVDASKFTDDQIGVAFKTLAAMQKRTGASGGVLPISGKATGRTFNEQTPARHPNFAQRDAK